MMGSWLKSHTENIDRIFNNNTVLLYSHFGRKFIDLLKKLTQLTSITDGLCYTDNFECPETFYSFCHQSFPTKVR